MGFNSDKQRRYVMGKLKGFFVDEKIDPKYLEEISKQKRPFSYEDYNLSTKEGRREGRIGWAMDKKNMTRQEAEEYVDSHRF